MVPTGSLDLVTSRLGHSTWSVPDLLRGVGQERCLRRDVGLCGVVWPIRVDQRQAAGGHQVAEGSAQGAFVASEQAGKFGDAVRCVFAEAHDEVPGLPVAHAFGTRGLDRSLQVRGQGGRGSGQVGTEVGTLPFEVGTLEPEVGTFGDVSGDRRSEVGTFGARVGPR